MLLIFSLAPEILGVHTHLSVSVGEWFQAPSRVPELHHLEVACDTQSSGPAAQVVVLFRDRDKKRRSLQTQLGRARVGHVSNSVTLRAFQSSVDGLADGEPWVRRACRIHSLQTFSQSMEKKTLSFKTSASKTNWPFCPAAKVSWD